MWDRLRKMLYEASEVMELFMAGAVVFGLLIAAAALGPALSEYWQHRMEAGAFLEYLDAVFNVVIGIEFIKMLCKPSSANIIEVLIFLIARHMIVTATTPLEDLLSVVRIGIIFYFRRFMPATKHDGGQQVPSLFKAIKPGGSETNGQETDPAAKDEKEEWGEPYGGR